MKTSRKIKVASLIATGQMIVGWTVHIWFSAMPVYTFLWAGLFGVAAGYFSVFMVNSNEVEQNKDISSYLMVMGWVTGSMIFGLGVFLSALVGLIPEMSIPILNSNVLGSISGLFLLWVSSILWKSVPDELGFEKEGV